MANKRSSSKQETGQMSVQEAGHRGGEATSERHGREFYEEIGQMGGQKGGQRVKELIEEGKQAENKGSESQSSSD